MRDTLQINLNGRFRVTSPDGSDLTPKSKKARAVLAMLSVSPDGERSRSWLRQMLWSRQDPAQGSASLRQCLSVLRKDLGAHRGHLVTKGQLVSLASTTRQDGAGEFLEDLDIRDPEFRRWRADHTLTLARHPQDNRPDPLDQDRPTVVSRVESREATARFFSELVADTVIQRLNETASIEAVEATGPTRDDGRLDLVLRTSAMKRDNHAGVRIRLEAADTGAVVWTGNRVLKSEALDELDAVELRRLMNHAVDAAAERYAQVRPSAHPGSRSSALGLRAVEKMFTLEAANLRESEDMLDMAGKLDARGIYFAWQAYLRIIQFGERLITDRDAVAEEAEAMVRRALESDRGNSMVLALASYVQSVIFKNYAAAGELALESLRVSKINPLAWSFLGIAQMHAGQPQRGFASATYARSICGHGPQRYQVAMLACQTAIVSGRFAEAIELAQLTVGLAPNYAPPKRYLAALLAHEERDQEALDVVADLKRLEPDFCASFLKEPAYPASALRLSPIVGRLDELLSRI